MVEKLALAELSLKPWELGKYTLKEFKDALEYKRSLGKAEFIRKAELATVIINACGCNIKKSIAVQDILGFDPYKKQEITKSKEEQEDELHYLKNKMGGEVK